jgi:hypothetical protein
MRRLAYALLLLALPAIGYAASAPAFPARFLGFDRPSALADDPTTSDTTPTTTDTTPTTTDTTPTTTDTTPTTTDTTPTTTDTTPTTTDTTPTTTDTTPTTTDTTPTTTDTTPTTTDTTPTTTDTTPTTTDTTPTTTTTVPSTSTVPSGEPAPPPPPRTTTVAPTTTASPTAPTPPPVQGLKAVVGDGSVTLTYNIPAGADHVVIKRSTAGGAAELVYNGTAETFTDRGLANGTEYRYVVASVNKAGNESAGVAILLVPRRNLLRAPKDGARLKKAPKLMWARDGEASYYNVQVMRKGVKILSVWPKGATYKLRRTWKYRGHKYTLKAGAYQWYVWPGYGRRSQVVYGQLLGTRSFRIVA